MGVQQNQLEGTDGGSATGFCRQPGRRRRKELRAHKIENQKLNFWPRVTFTVQHRSTIIRKVNYETVNINHSTVINGIHQQNQIIERSMK